MGFFFTHRWDFRSQYPILIIIAIIATIIMGTVTNIVPYFCVKAEADITAIDTTIVIIIVNLFKRLAIIIISTSLLSLAEIISYSNGSRTTRKVVPF